MPTRLISEQDTKPPLTVTAAATRLGYHVETVRRYLRSGSIRGIKLGHWRIPMDEMARLEGREWAQQEGELQ